MNKEDLRVKAINPVIDDNGVSHEDWVKHIVVDADEREVKWTVIQVETGAEYEGPIDLFPCRYTYEVGNEVKDEVEESVEE